MKYAFENLLRTPWEVGVAAAAFLCGSLCFLQPMWVGLDARTSLWASLVFVSLGWLRAFQGLRIVFYRKRLLTLKPFSMSTSEVPLSAENLYVGQGFQWLPLHRQRLHLLSQIHHQAFLRKNALYRLVQQRAHENPRGCCAALRKIQWLPFKPFSEIGGKPWLHGVGSESEKPIFLKQYNRKGHTLVLGRTQVGKTRLMSILVNQDIRNGEAVLVLDPKGDLEVLQDMYCACKVAGRLQDFKALHAGMPEVSAKYNPLSQFTNVSEVATRVASAIQAEGEGKQFQDFAWKFLNVVATCLAEMGETISYKSLAFFVTRPKHLLLTYCDKILPSVDPHYKSSVQEILDKNSSQLDRFGNPTEAMSRADAVRHYVARHIESVITQGHHHTLHDSIIADLYHAAQLGEEYYGKITASLGPVFDKINKTAAGDIFSWENPCELPIIRLEDLIKKKQIIYIGLDAMSNKAMSDAVGQAVIADLVSLCGRLYKEASPEKRTLCLYADEFSEIVRDEFITLLNKAGGAGIQVTAFSQTVNDIFASFGSNHDKPKMLLGNFGTIAVLRIANLDTARVFTECLEKIKPRSTTPSTMANDRSDGREGDLFTTHNTDIVSEEKVEIISDNDLCSLPKGQAFLWANGGELYKIRIPLPKNTGEAPSSFEALLRVVNGCSNNDPVSPMPNMDVQKNMDFVSLASIPEAPNATPSVNNAPVPVNNDNPVFVAQAFVAWLQARIQGHDLRYHPNAGSLIFSETLRHGTDVAFVTAALLDKYHQLHKVAPQLLQDALVMAGTSDAKKYQVRQNNTILPLVCVKGVSMKNVSDIAYEINEG